MKVSKPAKTVQELLRGPIPENSLLAEAIKLNPALEKQQRTMQPEQEVLLTHIVLGDPTVFGPRSRKASTVRYGPILAERLEAFFRDYSAVEKQRFIDVALDRLLSDLGY